MRSLKRPKNLAIRLLRISNLHIFDMFDFHCCLYTKEGNVWAEVANVARDTLTSSVCITFEAVEVIECDSYAITDDEDFLIKQRHIEPVTGPLRVSFEVNHE